MLSPGGYPQVTEVLWGRGIGSCGGGALPRRTGRSPVTTQAKPAKIIAAVAAPAPYAS
jgi:hypothetical protein